MAIAYVGSVGTAVTLVTGTTLTVTVGAGGVGAGHSVIVRFASSSGNTTTATVADSKGNTYNIDVSENNGGSNKVWIASAHGITALVNGDTITITLSASSSKRVMEAHEFSGLKATGTLDKTNLASGTSTAPTAGATGTLTQATELIFCADCVTIGSTTTCHYAADGSSTGLTERVTSQGSTDKSLTGEYRIVNATTTFTPSPTIDNLAWSSVVATYEGTTVSTITPTTCAMSMSQSSSSPTRKRQLQPGTNGSPAVGISISLGMSIAAVGGTLAIFPTGIPSSEAFGNISIPRKQTITFVRSDNSFTAGAGGSTLDVPITAPQPGNLLLLAAGVHHPASGDVTFSDPAGWSRVAEQTITGEERVCIWLKVSDGTETTVRVSGSGNASYAALYAEFSNTDNTGVIDGSSVAGTGSNVTTFDTGPLTPSDTKELVFAAIANQNIYAQTEGGDGYTLLGNVTFGTPASSNKINLAVYYQIQGNTVSTAEEQPTVATATSYVAAQIAIPPSVTSAGTQSIQPSGIASSEAFGSESISPQTEIAAPAGIPSSEAFGNTVLVGGAAGPYRRQAAIADNGGVAAATMTVTWPETTLAGSTLLMGVTINEHAPGAAVVSPPNGWTQIGGDVDSAGKVHMVVYAIQNASARSGSESITFDSARTAEIAILEYGNTLPSSLDVVSQGTGPVGDLIGNTATVTPTTAADVVVAFVGTVSNPVQTFDPVNSLPTSGWNTVLQEGSPGVSNSSKSGMGVYDIVLTQITPAKAVVDLSVGQANVSMIIALKGFGPPQAILPIGVGSSEAFGGEIISTGSVQFIQPPGIPSAEAFGVAASPIARGPSAGLVQPTVNYSGSANVTGPITITDRVFSSNMTFTGAGIVVYRCVFQGTIALSDAVDIDMQDIWQTYTGVSPALTVGGVGVGTSGSINRIDSEGFFGRPYVADGVVHDFAMRNFIFKAAKLPASLAQIIAPSGIASSEAFGSEALKGLQGVVPSGIATSEAFGMPTISSPGSFTPGSPTTWDQWRGAAPFGLSNNYYTTTRTDLRANSQGGIIKVAQSGMALTGSLATYIHIDDPSSPFIFDNLTNRWTLKNAICYAIFVAGANVNFPLRVRFDNIDVQNKTPSLDPTQLDPFTGHFDLTNCDFGDVINPQVTDLHILNGTGAGGTKSLDLAGLPKGAPVAFSGSIGGVEGYWSEEHAYDALKIGQSSHSITFRSATFARHKFAATQGGHSDGAQLTDLDNSALNAVPTFQWCYFSGGSNSGGMFLNDKGDVGNGCLNIVMDSCLIHYGNKALDLAGCRGCGTVNSWFGRLTNAAFPSGPRGNFDNIKITATTPAVLNSTGSSAPDIGMDDGDQVNISGLTKVTNANGTWYAHKTGTGLYSLYHDAAFTSPVVGNGGVDETLVSPQSFAAVYPYWNVSTVLDMGNGSGNHPYPHLPVFCNNVFGEDGSPITPPSPGAWNTGVDPEYKYAQCPWTGWNNLA